MAPLILKRASAGKRCYTIPGASETIGQNTIFCSNREPKTWQKADENSRPKIPPGQKIPSAWAPARCRSPPASRLFDPLPPDRADLRSLGWRWIGGAPQFTGCPLPCSSKFLTASSASQTVKTLIRRMRGYGTGRASGLSAQGRSAINTFSRWDIDPDLSRLAILSRHDPLCSVGQRIHIHDDARLRADEIAAGLPQGFLNHGRDP